MEYVDQMISRCRRCGTPGPFTLKHKGYVDIYGRVEVLEGPMYVCNKCDSIHRTTIFKDIIGYYSINVGRAELPYEELFTNTKLKYI